MCFFLFRNIADNPFPIFYGLNHQRQGWVVCIIQPGSNNFGFHAYEEAQKLDIGSEINQGQLEQTVLVKVGDDLDKLVGTEILLEDGKIIAIRQ